MAVEYKPLPDGGAMLIVETPDEAIHQIYYPPPPKPNVEVIEDNKPKEAL